MLADGHEGPGRDLNGGSQRGGTAAGAALGTPAAIPSGGTAAAYGDLYMKLLEAVCMLVTDPHPQVAGCAAAVLRVADVELTVMPVSVSQGAFPLALQSLGHRGVMAWASVGVGKAGADLTTTLTNQGIVVQLACSHHSWVLHLPSSSGLAATMPTVR